MARTLMSLRRGGKRSTTEQGVVPHFGLGEGVETASVMADSIRADLGSIGKVDVVRHPSGREKTVHLKCLGGAWTYEPGTYEGVIEFNGGELHAGDGESRGPVARLAYVLEPRPLRKRLR